LAWNDLPLRRLWYAPSRTLKHSSLRTFCKFYKLDYPCDCMQTRWFLELSWTAQLRWKSSPSDIIAII